MHTRLEGEEQAATVAAVPPALEMLGISKRFPGVQALDDVSLVCLPGEVHALVGENGAGKSTLMKILAGAYRRDTGEIRIGGEAVELASPTDAQLRGVGMVYQELNLVPDLTVAENIYLGRQPTGRLGIVDRRALREQATVLLDELNAPVRADDFVRDLSVGQRQMVEIAKAYSLSPRILVLDEPTSALTEHETSILFATVRNLRDRGIAVIFISHRLKEVMTIADRVTVMRDGKLVGTKRIADIVVGDIVRMMVGRDVTDMFPKRVVPIGDVVLQVRGLTRAGAFEDVTFEVHAGEILGIAGLVGAGRTEVARAIFGLDPHDSGEILLGGTSVRIRGPRDALHAGIGYVPEERKVDGLVLSLSVRDNTVISVLSRLARAGLITKRMETPTVRAMIERMGLRPPDPDRVVLTLSGGNQQKVVMGRWVSASSRVLFLDEPTRGVDVGAKAEIHGLMGELAAHGVAIVMISSELVEVLSASDRVMVLHQGRVTGVFDRAEATEERIMHAATGQTMAAA
jgi:ABC-type sugar transport system ATPase subunit